MASADAKSTSTPRVRYYREFLTPALHRRFVKAAGILLVVCFVEGVLTRNWSSIFWLLFPLGRTGIFALLLSLSALVIFLLRLTHLHFGRHTTLSPASTFSQAFLSAAAAETLIFYVLSAWWFSEVYIWTTPDEFHWIVEGRSYERPRVNEWPVYLRCFFFVLAVVEASFHLASDESRIQLPCPQPPADKQRASSTPSPLDQIRATIVTLLFRSATVALSITICFPFVYPLTIRKYAWSWSVSLARIFWSVSKSTDTPASLPYHYSVLLRSLTAGTELLFLWRVSNFAFDAFVAVPPMKGSKPLSSDSKDPNGSLLLGLKSKKEMVREFAFWELNLISTSDEARRITMFKELDRNDGSTWSQILNATLKPIEAISERIADFNGPTAEAKAAQGKKVMALPKLSAPLQEGQVLRGPMKMNNTTEALESAFGDFAKSMGNSSSPRPLDVVISWVQSLISPEAQKALSLRLPATSSMSIDLGVLRSAVNSLFQNEPSRQALMVIFGAPRSDLRPILLSIDSITNLALRALKEDEYGSVCKDIPRILRSFVNASSTIQMFLRELLTGKESGSLGKEDGDIDLLFRFLREALQAILEGYEQYGSDIGLGPTEVQEVYKAASLCQ